MDMLGPIEIECPECDSKFKVRLEDFAKERTKPCPRGHSVKLVDEGHGAREAQKSMDKLEKSIADLNQTLKF